MTFFPPIDIEQLGDRKKLAEYCYQSGVAGVQAANSGRPELLPSLAEPALIQPLRPSTLPLRPLWPAVIETARSSTGDR